MNDGPKLRQVIESWDKRGSGRDEDDPHRGVHQFHDIDGTLLMECDEWHESQSASLHRHAYAALMAMRQELHRPEPNLARIKDAANVAINCLEGRMDSFMPVEDTANAR